jgi:hypothetical protein
MLLIVPIGGPVLLWVVVWIIAGFQKAEGKLEKPQQATANQSPASPRSSADYYSIITRAVSALPNNTRRHRQELYDRAHDVLDRQLGGQSRSQVRPERRALSDAIRRVEAEAAERERRERKLGSTPLLVISIFLPGWWMQDCTAMSLYWVARLPKLDG